MNSDINVALTCIGPETLMLWYLKPLQFNVNNHKVVSQINSEQAADAYIRELINDEIIGQNSPAIKTWYFPDSGRGPEVVLAAMHDFVDGEGAVSFIQSSADGA